jgi:hypothetical protein
MLNRFAKFFSFAFFVFATGYSAQVFANVQVTCILENCLEQGWHLYDQRNGYSSLVRCQQNDCANQGWVEESRGRIVSQTLCKENGCFNDGWQVTDLNTGRLLADISCLNSFATSDCLENGWTTFEPGRGSYTTRCVNGDCRFNGWDVFIQGFAPQPIRCKEGGCFTNGWTIYR